MPFRAIHLPWAAIRWVVVIGVLVVGGLTYSRWWPPLNAWVEATSRRFRPAGGASGHGAAAKREEAGHADHAAEAGRPADQSIEVSAQALQNLGLTPQFLRPVTKSTYWRSIRVPAVIVEQPGRTRIQVATPMTAIITRLHAVSGQSVQPGQLLFTLRLTHEDLVTSQTEFLKTLGEVDVERAELERLQKVTAGAIPPNVILERKYAVQKLESRLAADREALKLHGLNDQQVQSIERDRKLLRTLEIYAPSASGSADSEYRLTDARLRKVSLRSNGEYGAEAAPTAEASDDAAQPAESRALVLEELKVHQGQALNAGDPLCVLADYSRLYIEGQSFERDAAVIVAARERGWTVTGHFEGDSADAERNEWPIAYIANEVDVAARTLHFYVELPNEMLPQPPRATGHQYISWRYRPGQRLELEVPVEEWADQLVLPVSAVAQEGAESYVFLQNGKRFDRKSVHVKHRDPSSVVIANDGTIFPGDIVALRGAHQLQMALKNKSGGGVDPHAGHTH